MAVDSAVMVIDGPRIEPQTRKLFQICKMGIPIFTFINKYDRDAEPLDLMNEIEETSIETYPMDWPIGMGRQFMGFTIVA